MSEHTWLEHAAPYALGALDDGDRVSFEAHLEACDVCKGEVRELREVAGLLATAAPHVTPPAGLRDRIMSDARAVRPMSVATSRPVAPTREAAAAPVFPQQKRVAVLPWVTAIAAGITAIILGTQYRGERTARANAEQALAQARSTIDSGATALAQRDSLIASLVATDVQAVSVSGTGPAPSARYFLDRRAGRIVIAASSLPPAAAGRTYQLWGIETGRPPVSLGTFNTDSSGRALASLSVPSGLRIAVTAITDEPTGGSAQPTTTPFLAATWRSE